MGRAIPGGPGGTPPGAAGAPGMPGRIPGTPGAPGMGPAGRGAPGGPGAKPGRAAAGCMPLGAGGPASRAMPGCCGCGAPKPGCGGRGAATPGIGAAAPGGRMPGGAPPGCGANPAGRGAPGNPAQVDQRAWRHSQFAARQQRALCTPKEQAEALPHAQGSHLLPPVLARLRRWAAAVWDQAAWLQGSRLRRRAWAAAHTLRTGGSRRQRDARRVAAAAARYGAAAAGRPPPVLRIPPIALPHAPRPTHGPGGRGGGRAGRSQAGLLRRVASGPRHRRAGTCRSKLEGSAGAGARRAGSADELGAAAATGGRNAPGWPCCCCAYGL